MTEANISGKTFEVKSGKNGYVINGSELSPDLKKLHPRLWHVLHKNSSVKVFVNKIDKEKRIVELVVNGKPVEVQLKTRAEQLLKSIGMEGALRESIFFTMAPSIPIDFSNCSARVFNFTSTAFPFTTSSTTRFSLSILLTKTFTELFLWRTCQSRGCNFFKSGES
ncbi:MAG: hypothetical protein AAGD28_17050, partial [Bacteroidota bacterium]